MARKGYKTINIPPSLIAEIEQSTQFDQEAEMFHKWVVCTVENIIYKRRFLSIFAKEIKIESVSKNGIILEDTKIKKGTLIKVSITKNNDVTCSYCKKNLCKHILFAVGSPEFGASVKNHFAGITS